MFCPHSVKCEHWGNKIDGKPKCYYGEPQCIRGKMDELFSLMKVVIYRD